MDEKTQRLLMVENQLIPRGIYDKSTLEAMRNVPRHHFVSSDQKNFAYSDRPLPIEDCQTISQPYIVALMTQSAAIKPTDKVLEIGTGSGYAAAILSQIAKEVYTVERFPTLAKIAQERFEKEGYKNIITIVGDGTKGYVPKAPYQAILVTARANQVPKAYIEQLDVNGRLVIPVGDAFMQELLLITKRPSGQLTSQVLEQVRFVDLVSDQN